MQKSEELQEIIANFYKAFETNDRKYLENTISNEEGTVCIGTDPDDWMFGYKSIMKAFERQGVEIDYEHNPPEYIQYDPKAFIEGTVGWFYDNATIKMSSENFVEMRITGVFHKEGSNWKLVQMHSSIAASNVGTDRSEIVDMMTNQS